MDNQRIEGLIKFHEKAFKTKADAVFSTSGRTELGGNHTDHNLGKVLAGSINLDTEAAVHKTDDNKIYFISEGYREMHVDLDNLNVDENLFGKSEAMIKGVANAILKRGGRIGGFCANANSTVLPGSGLSSSACFEVLIGTIFNNLYNDDRFTPVELAIMGQEAENVYFGKPSGLMDQVACAHGGIVCIDFRDRSNPVIVPVEADFKDYGYDFIVVSTGGSHANLTPDYSAIPFEMKSVAKFFGKEVLREVSYDDFIANIGQLRKFLENDRAVLRAYHYFEENIRVDKMLAALKNKDFKSYLNLVRQTGNSSFCYLQNVFSPASFKEQGISSAYAMTENFLKDEGAFRVQGGGFAGTIEAYVPCDKTSAYVKHMESLFGKDCCVKLSIRNTPTKRIF